MDSHRPWRLGAEDIYIFIYIYISDCICSLSVVLECNCIFVQSAVFVLTSGINFFSFPSIKQICV